MAEPLHRQGKDRGRVNGWDYEAAGPKSRLANRAGGGIVVVMMLRLGLSGPEPRRHLWSGVQGDRGMDFFQAMQVALMRQR